MQMVLRTSVIWIQRDLDSDNDGVFDLLESQSDMLFMSTLDDDRNGVIDNTNPVGVNGFADVLETAADSDSAKFVLSDTDGDGLADYLDRDADNDGLLDTIESGHTDVDLDGVVDTPTDENLFFDQSSDVFAVDGSGLRAGAGLLPVNSDNDGVSNFRDVDSDNDGMFDVIESFGSEFDVDREGRLGGFEDVNGDGVHDEREASLASIADTDGDGIPDALELDSDGDGITDILENGGIDSDGDGHIDNLVDSNGDGVDDGVAILPIEVLDTDNDGIPNYQDQDSDGDGISDILESGGQDVDGDGQADSMILGAALPDIDGDGVPDHIQAAQFTLTTGVSSSGCSVTPVQQVRAGKHDPLLLLMVLMSMSWVLSRRVKAFQD